MITHVQKDADGIIKMITLTAQSTNDSTILASLYTDYLQNESDGQWPQLPSGDKETWNYLGILAHDLGI